MLPFVCVFLNFFLQRCVVSEYRFLPPWLGLFLGSLFFLLLDQMGFFFLISVSDISLLVYKNAFDF